jgi:hypothetical protein
MKSAKIKPNNDDKISYPQSTTRMLGLAVTFVQFVTGP